MINGTFSRQSAVQLQLQHPIPESNAANGKNTCGSFHLYNVYTVHTHSHIPHKDPNHEKHSIFTMGNYMNNK